MRELFLSVLIGFTYLVWLGKAETANERVEKIDVQIEQLREKKRGYEGRAVRAENQADRMQFNDESGLETRKLYRIAEENRNQAQLIQQEIDRLEQEREGLIHKK